MSACLPAQLVSVSNIRKSKLLALLSLTVQVIYFFEGLSLKVSTNCSNSFDSGCVTISLSNSSV